MYFIAVKENDRTYSIRKSVMGCNYEIIKIGAVMNPNENDIVGFGFDSCYLDFRFCCTGYKRTYAGQGWSQIWSYSFSSLSHGVKWARIEIVFAMSVPVSWAAFSTTDGCTEAKYAGGQIVVTSESIESIQMQAANCIYGPGPLAQVLCNVLSQCDERYQKSQVVL